MSLKKHFLITLIAVTFLGINGCINEENTSNPTVPQLIQRPDQILYDKEWEITQNNYMEAKISLENNEKAVAPRLNLAKLYIAEARITGEHGHYYPAALKVLDEIFEIDQVSRDQKFQATLLKAGVLLSQHQFSEALKYGIEAHQVNSKNAQALGVLVDAHVELGNYDEAIKYADQMVLIKPDIRSYSRISYLREIYGDLEGSIESMKYAVQAGLPGTEDRAWAMLTLGELYLQKGDVERSKMLFQSILEERPDYPFAYGALGALYAQIDETQKAHDYLNEGIKIIPEVSFYMEKAKLLKNNGSSNEYRILIGQIEEMLQDDVDSGHTMDLEYVDLYLNIVDDAEKALEYALKAYNERPKNIDVNYHLANIYKELNRMSEAEKHANIAQNTGKYKM